MALIFDSSDIIPTDLDPRNEGNPVVDAMKKDKVKASVPSIRTAPSNKTTSDTPKSYKRKEVPATSSKPLTSAEKRKVVASKKEKKRTKKGLKVVIRELGPAAEVLEDKALIFVVARISEPR